MIELENDIVIRCEQCGEVLYLSRELYDPSESYFDHGENGMGIEILANISDETDCPCCRNPISFELNASLYAGDLFNDNPRIVGGSFVQEPLMEFINDEGEEGFYQWAYDQADDVKRMILDIAVHRDRMYGLHSRDFELLVERVFRDKGFRTELTQATRDGGKDIIARRHIGTKIPIIIYIECKKFAPDHPVGEPIVRDLYGVMTDARINRAMLVTSSYFSRDASSFVKRQGGLIELIDGDLLYRMIVHNANKYFEEMR